MAAPANIQNLRKRIDQLDRRLVGALNERTHLSSKIGQWKLANGHPVFAPEREENILRLLEKRSEAPLSRRGLRAIYREILSISRACQKPLGVAYLGKPGSSSFHAARDRFGACELYAAKATAAEFLGALKTGRSEVGVLAREEFARHYWPGGAILRKDLGRKVHLCGEIHVAPVNGDKAGQVYYMLSRRAVPSSLLNQTIVWVETRRDEEKSAFRAALKRAKIGIEREDVVQKGSGPGRCLVQFDLAGEWKEETLIPLLGKARAWRVAVLGAYPKVDSYE